MPKLSPIKIDAALDEMELASDENIVSIGGLTIKENCYEIKDNPQANEDALITSEPVDNEAYTLREELRITKMQLKQAKEERCLDALSVVLKAHNCSLKALDNGSFQCEWMG
jgi:hypothetical protein